MKYKPSKADQAPVPTEFLAQAKYVGYRDEDRQHPWAKYFSEKCLPVQSHVEDSITAGPVAAELGVRLGTVADEMSRPGYLPLETGYTQNVDGHLIVAVLTDMPGVTGEMWDWWFGWHSTQSSRYKLWHPEAHIATGVGEDRSQMQGITDRQKYIENVSYIDEYIGDEYSRLTVRFADPQKQGFPPSGPGETTILARGGAYEAPVGFAWLVHQIRQTEDGCEMRSRFILNVTELFKLPAHSVTTPVGKLLTTRPVNALAAGIFRRLKGAKLHGFCPALLYHCAQEMNHLASILPDLYEEFGGTP